MAYQFMYRINQTLLSRLRIFHLSTFSGRFGLCAFRWPSIHLMHSKENYKR